MTFKFLAAFLHQKYVLYKYIYCTYHMYAKSVHQNIYTQYIYCTYHMYCAYVRSNSVYVLSTPSKRSLAIKKNKFLAAFLPPPFP